MKKGFLLVLSAGVLFFGSAAVSFYLNRGAPDELPPGVKPPAPAARSQPDLLPPAKEPAAAEPEARSKNAELIYQDLRNVRAESDALLKQATELLKAVEARLAAVEQRPAAAPKLDGALRQPAQLVEVLPPAKAAEVFLQMAADGKLELVLKLLGAMQERKAAEVLARLPDADLAARLREQLARLRQTALTP